MFLATTQGLNMSSIARWSNTVLATIWRKGPSNSTGGYSWGAPEYILVSYRIGGAKKFVDSTGAEFTPKSTYWTEMLTKSGVFLDKLKIGDKIQLGEFTGNPTSAADYIKVVQIDGAEMFGAAEMPDYMVMT